MTDFGVKGYRQIVGKPVGTMEPVRPEVILPHGGKTDDVTKIHDAWDKEGSIRRLGMPPAADKTIQAALVPPGGDWRCVAPEGASTRSIIWQEMEVATVNPRGDMLDRLEGEIAMGLCATPIMDRALRVIYVLAMKPENLDLIGRIARAAIDYVERQAPEITEPEDEEEYEEDDHL